MDYLLKSAYDLGCFGVFREKPDGSRYGIEDLISDLNVTDKETQDKMKKSYSDGLWEFIRLQSIS